MMSAPRRAEPIGRRGRRATALRRRFLRRALVLAAILGAACRPAPLLEEWTLGLEPMLEIGADPVTLQTAFYRPLALGFDHQGNIFVLDSGNHRVQVFDAEGNYVRSIGEPGEGPGQLGDPQGMFVHPDGRVWLADTTNRRVQPYAADGTAAAPMTVDFFPLDLVVGPDRIFVQRMPQTSMVYGPDKTPLITVLDHAGRMTGGFVAPVATPIGLLYMLENMMALSPGPDGGVAVAHTHFSSLLRRYRAGGSLIREIPVLYKAGAWAPLGRRPLEITDESLARLARTSTDLAWDRLRGLFWVLAGYVDQTAAGEWIVGREIYRYAPDGEYRGSLMLPLRASTIALAPDGKLWVIDIDGIVHAYRVTDPDTQPLLTESGEGETAATISAGT